jgi:erythronate-4-phosphate dehydrogenase
MKIVADENIPFVMEAFSSLGEVFLKKGREIKAEDVREADVLLVRSVTRVDRRLLHGSRVFFVGTATSGTDHVDKGYLQSRGIAFFDAAGSNATSVAEYVVAALLEYAFFSNCDLAGKGIGIIGVGHVGSRVCEMARALGMETVLNDPPRRQQSGLSIFRPLHEALECDVVTLHVPLVLEGDWPTRGLAERAFFSHIKEGAFFINTSRGEVVEEAVLREAIAAGRLSFACLDVWAGEPNISRQTLQAVSIGTPHIAGYSYDAKVRGTEMIYRALCNTLGRMPLWSADTALGSIGRREIKLDPSRHGTDILRCAVREAYDIRKDDSALRSGADFDLLRKEYPIRREFSAHSAGGAEDGMLHMLSHLGFKTSLRPFSA